MYLARFDGNNEAWIQAVAALHAEHVSTPGAAAAAAVTSRQLCLAAMIPRSTVARRVSLDDEGRLTEVMALTVPAASEAEVRAIVARLSRVERIHDVRLSLASSAEERDAWMEVPQRLRLAVSTAGFQIRSIPLGCPFRLEALRARLFDDARRLRHAISYQVHLRAADPSLDEIRTVRKGAQGIRDLPGAPAPLVDLQDTLARGLAEASAYCEEYLAVDGADVARMIECEVGDAFRARFRPLGFPSFEPRFESDGFREAMTTGLHGHDLEPFDPAALSGLVESAAGRDALLSWTPASSPSLEFDACPPAEDPVPSPPRVPEDDEAPTPDGANPQVFISYKRTDAPRVWPIIRALQRHGVGVWYDRGIPGGVEWDTVLESQLQRARVVVLCASPAAIESRHVRREVKFADACNIPVMPVLLEETELSHGLRMMLTSTQMLDTRHPGFDIALRDAIRGLLAKPHREH